MLSNKLVTECLNYLNDEKIVRELPQVKMILETFPNSKIQRYRRK